VTAALQLTIATTVKVAIVVALVGLVYRRRYAHCWSMAAYLLGVLVCELLIALWPARFFTPWFWLVKQAVYDVLKMAVAMEVAYRVVQAFPGAMRTAKRSAVFLLGVSTVVIFTAPLAAGYHTVAEWEPRTLSAIVWLFALTALLVVWYHLPLRAWHRAILIGFTPYLLFFGAILGVLQHSGWQLLSWMGVVDSFAYLAAMAWWAYAAWAPERIPAAVPSEVLRALHLEHV